MRELLLPNAEEVVAKVVDMAKKGDATALRICIDRLLPPIKARDEPVAVPSLTGSLSDRGRVVLDALAGEQLTPDQAGAILSVIAPQARIVALEWSSVSLHWR